MSLKEIMAKVLEENRQFPCSWVCLTGGEPLLQPIAPLVQAIRKAGFYVQIETNGTLNPLAEVNWWTVSPKPPDYLLQPAFRWKAKELKLIVTRDLNVRIIEQFRRFLPMRTPIILQPQSGQRWSERKAFSLIKLCRQQGFENLRLMIQLHRQLRIR